MFYAIGDNLTNRACSHDEEDRNDEQNGLDKAYDKLREHGKPCWVIGTVSKTVELRMERFRQQQMRIDSLTQSCWGDTGNYFRERDTKYETA